MLKTVTAIKARQNLGQVLNEAYYRGDEFVIERAGKPIAAIVSIEEFEQWARSRNLFFQSVQRIQEQNRRVSPDRVEKDVADAVKAVRSRKK